MSLPAIEDCVLRTTTLEDFKEVMGKPVGEYSLLDAICSTYTDLSLGQQLPRTSAYPTLMVCDLTPATSGTLSENTTLIVLPPVDSTPSHQDEVSQLDASAPTRKTDDALLVPEGELEIRLCRGMVGTRAEGTSRVLDDLLVPEGGLLRIGNEAYACYFTVYVAPDMEGIAADSQTLRVSPELFRNIRAAYLNDVGFQATPHSFSDTRLNLPWHLLNPVEDSEGNVETLKDSSPEDAQLRLDKLVLCPALDNLFLCNIFGDHYADLMEALLTICASKLHGRLLSEGNVVTLHLTQEDLQGSPPSIGGLDVLEAIFATLKHQTETFSGVWTSPDTLSLFPFRVVELWRGGEPVNYGYAWFGDASPKRQTGFSLASQSTFKATEYTPLFASLIDQEEVEDRLEAQEQLYASLNQFLVANQKQTAFHTFVVHGLKENGVYSFIDYALREFGVLPMFASAEGLDDEELRTLLGRFGETSGQVALVVKNAESIAANHPELFPLLQQSEDPVLHASDRCPRVILLVCETQEAVPPAMAARATNPEGVIPCGNPSEEDRARLARRSARRAARAYHLHLSPFLSFRAIAGWTVGLSCADIVAYMQACTAAVTSRPYLEGVMPVLSDRACERVLQDYLKSHGLTLVSTKLQPVRWSDVGGLVEAKRELKETIQLPILYPEIFASGMKKRTGILFYGPPGCGKTLLAKAVATEMNMNFMSVKGPELINQYVGESERNIRVLFQKARDNSPCIVFFDELDALAPARGAKGDAGGAMDRIVSQLLVEVDGIGQTRSDGTASGQVFIIGATNRPDLLDPSLLRPGRFDRLCYLGIPSTREEQLHAVRALTRKFDLHDDVNFDKLLEPLDFVYTGADFFALCSDAMMFSVEEALECAKVEVAGYGGAVGGHRDGSSGAVDDNLGAPIKVKMSHFLAARDQLKASVTKEDLRRYESLKTKFSR
ncbi:unnamed protein product [Phytomonas sp. EM1]|nr:unnamed protein product [Phytomonas sp. EM1]|eukprot:CCW64959.1 unnamed protein product [Phytomonas sp. isolate EM1]